MYMYDDFCRQKCKYVGMLAQETHKHISVNFNQKDFAQAADNGSSHDPRYNGLV